MATPYVKIEYIDNHQSKPGDSGLVLQIKPSTLWKSNSDDVCQYSYAGFSGWKTYTPGESISFGYPGSNVDGESESRHGRIYFRGKLSSAHAISSSENPWLFNYTGTDFARDGVRFSISGSISALFDYENPDVSVASSACAGMFKHDGDYNSWIVSASELELDVMSDHCYSNMFYDNNSLIFPPKLPRTTLSESCYSQMFANCEGLNTPPSLPATTLASHCYERMFANCLELIAAPALPATTLEEFCYYYMFSGCSALIIPPALPALNVPSYAYFGMFYACQSLVIAPKISATSFSDHACGTMFTSCTDLVIPPKINTTDASADEVFQQMFFGCSSLSVSTSGTKPPILFYTNYSANSVKSMFSGTAGPYTSDPEPNVKYYSDPGETVNAKVYDALITAVSKAMEHCITSGGTGRSSRLYRGHSTTTAQPGGGGSFTTRFMVYLFSLNTTAPSGYVTSISEDTIKSDLDAYLNSLGIGSTTAFKQGAKAEARHYIYLTQAIAEFITGKTIHVLKSSAGYSHGTNITGNNIGDAIIISNQRTTLAGPMAYKTGAATYNNPAHINKTEANITESDINTIMTYLIDSALNNNAFITTEASGTLKSSSSSCSSSCSSSSSSSCSSSCSSSNSCSSSSIFIAYFNI